MKNNFCEYNIISSTLERVTPQLVRWYKVLYFISKKINRNITGFVFIIYLIKRFFELKNSYLMRYSYILSKLC